MNRDQLRQNLLDARKANGVGATLTGEKLRQAEEYLKAAENALVAWTRDVYANADALDMWLVHVRETLELREQIERIAEKIKARAGLLGR